MVKRVFNAIQQRSRIESMILLRRLTSFSKSVITRKCTQKIFCQIPGNNFGRILPKSDFKKIEAWTLHASLNLVLFNTFDGMHFRLTFKRMSLSSLWTDRKIP